MELPCYWPKPRSITGGNEAVAAEVLAIEAIEVDEPCIFFSCCIKDERSAIILKFELQ